MKQPEETAEKSKGLSILRPYLSLLKGQTGDLLATLLLMFIATGVSLSIPIYRVHRFIFGSSLGKP